MQSVKQNFSFCKVNFVCLSVYDSAEQRKLLCIKRRIALTPESDPLAALVPVFATPPELSSGAIALPDIVSTLPPKERACVLLKDVFDYSLEEIAELAGSTVGGVKAALSRGRAKLASAPPARKSSRNADPELTRIMQLYVDRFNRRDWNGVRELISADARLNVADAFAGRLADAPYFTNYERWSMPWRLQLGDVEGEPVVLILKRGADTWTPHSAVRFNVVGQQIQQIIDYAHCPWVIPAATR